MDPHLDGENANDADPPRLFELGQFKHFNLPPLSSSVNLSLVVRY